MNDDNGQAANSWDIWVEAASELEDEQGVASSLAPWMDDDGRYTDQCQELDRLARGGADWLLRGLRAEENQQLVEHVRQCPYCRLRTYASLGLAEAAGFAVVLDHIQHKAWGGRAARELADDALDALATADAPDAVGPTSVLEVDDLEGRLLQQFVVPLQDDLLRDAVEGVVGGDAPGERLLWDYVNATTRQRLRQEEASVDPGRCLVHAFEELLMLLRSGALVSHSAGALDGVLGGLLGRALELAREHREADREVVSLAAFRERTAGARRAAASRVSQALAGLEEKSMAAGPGPMEHLVEVEGQHLILRAIHAEHSGDGRVLLVLREEGSELLKGKGVLLAREEIPMGYGPFLHVSGLNMARVSLTPMDIETRPMMAFNPDEVLAHFRLEVVDDPLGN